MHIDRRLKIMMSGGLAILCGLIAVGNIHDPELNYQFVKHVLSMDTVLPSSTMATHALPIPILWTVGFWMIVVGEATTAILFAV